jgi:hypothetical protein
MPKSRHFEEQEDSCSLPPLTPNLIKNTILTEMRSLFGYLGTGTDIDLIDCDAYNKIVILRVLKSALTPLWSTLTLSTTYENKACRFEILKVSPFLASLANTSRTLFASDYELLLEL